MGNKCVITTREDFDNDGIGIYLHWGGGRDSVEAFLKYCELKQHRSVTDDASYAYARLCQVIGNFFGGSLSIGIDSVRNLDCDNYDNGNIHDDAIEDTQQDQHPEASPPASKSRTANVTHLSSQ